MGTDEKFENKAEEVKGGAKETVGELTDDEKLEAEGQAEQILAKGKQVIEEIKDKISELVDEATERLKEDNGEEK